MASTGLVVLLRSALPPSILFFAGSSARAADLLVQLQIATNPLRVVALLDPARLGHVGYLARLDLLRTSDEKTWKSMVHRLMEIASIYVVDTVARSGPVRYEAFLVLDPERVGRAVFISNESGVCPSLHAEGIDPAEHAIPVANSASAGDAVRRLLRNGGLRPREEKGRIRPLQRVVPEDWNSLPSMLMIALPDGFDGERLLAQVRQTDKDLVALLLPLSSLDAKIAKLSVELSWDFARNDRLVGFFFQEAGLIILRRNFLLAHAALFNFHIPGVAPGRLTFDDLNKPEPVSAALLALSFKLADAAKRGDLEFRFVRK